MNKIIGRKENRRKENRWTRIMKIARMMQRLRQSPEIKIRQPGCPEENGKRNPFVFSMHAKTKITVKGKRESHHISLCFHSFCHWLTGYLCLLSHGNEIIGARKYGITFENFRMTLEACRYENRRKKGLIRKCRRKAIYWKLLDWFSGARESAVSTTMRDDIVIISESMRCFSLFFFLFFSPSFSSPLFFFDFQGERRARE